MKIWKFSIHWNLSSLFFAFSSYSRAHRWIFFVETLSAPKVKWKLYQNCRSLVQNFCICSPFFIDKTLFMLYQMLPSWAYSIRIRLGVQFLLYCSCSTQTLSFFNYNNSFTVKLVSCQTKGRSCRGMLIEFIWNLRYTFAHRLSSLSTRRREEREKFIKLRA